MRHKELKDHLRKEKTVCVPQGKRNPVNGLEASGMASEYLNLPEQKVKKMK